MATQRGASLGLRPEDLRPEWMEGINLIHVPAYSLFHEPLAAAARAAVDMARSRGGALAVDLSSVAGLLEYGPAPMGAGVEILKPDPPFAPPPAAGTPGGVDGLPRARGGS